MSSASTFSGRLQMRVICALAAALAIAGASPASAEFKVRSPILDYGEVEFEHNGSITFDKNKSGKNNAQSYTNEVEIGFLPFWTIGLEAETGADPGRNLRYEATTLENYFQFTPQGKYWADLGFFAEISRPSRPEEAISVTFGPLIQKEGPALFGFDSLHTANVLFEKEVGHLADPATPLFVGWQSRLRIHPLFEPGFEYYGQLGDVSQPGKLADQQHRIGPVLAGYSSFAPYGKLKYEVGYLVGLTRATERGTVRWRLEYEMAF